MVDRDTRDSTLRMHRAIANWIDKLNDFPGWREWKTRQIGHILYFDDEIKFEEDGIEEFRFSDDIENEHRIITLYLSLFDSLESLRDVEWYFRRYPFSGTRVTRYNHLSNCCELFFSRLYQFKERLKNLLNEVKIILPENNIKAGELIKLFNRMFEDELRARHGIHHKEKFSSIELSRVTVMELVSVSQKEEIRHQDYLLHYRRAANEWAARVRRRTADLEIFVEAVSLALLKVCPFLDDADSR